MVKLGDKKGSPPVIQIVLVCFNSSTDTTCIKEYFGVIPELDSNGSVKRDSIKKVIKGLYDNGFQLTLKNKEVKDRSFTDSEVHERWKDALNLGTYKLNNILEITFFAI